MRVRVTHRELVYGTDSCGKNWPAIVDEMLIKKPTSSNLHSGRKSLKVRTMCTPPFTFSSLTTPCDLATFCKHQ